MLFSKSKKDPLSNENLQEFLESLKYTHAERPKNHKAWEYIRFSEIEKKSIVWAKLLTAFALEGVIGRFTLGNYGYSVSTSKLERTSPSIKLKKKWNPFFTVTGVFTEDIKQIIKPKGRVMVD